MSGPTVTTTYSCEHCDHCDTSRAYFPVAEIFCIHPNVCGKLIGEGNFDTPFWCPVITLSIKNKEPFETQLRHLINTHSLENGSDTPDYILAEYLLDSLDAFDNATKLRDKHKND